MMNQGNPQDRDLLLNVPDHVHGQDLRLQLDQKVVLMLVAKNRVVEVIRINISFEG